MADDALAGFDDGEEILLGEDLGVVSVAEGHPTAPLLRHLLHLLKPPLPQSLDVVQIEPIQSRDLIVDLILDGFCHCQHLLLYDLQVRCTVWNANLQNKHTEIKAHLFTYV